MGSTHLDTPRREYIVYHRRHNALENEQRKTEAGLNPLIICIHGTSALNDPLLSGIKISKTYDHVKVPPTYLHPNLLSYPVTRARSRNTLHLTSTPKSPESETTGQAGRFGRK